MEFKVGDTMLTVGTKVLLHDPSYIMELTNGAPVRPMDNKFGNNDSRVARGDDKDVYTVTAVNAKLPTDGGTEVNDTMVTWNGRVFFVQQRFLREYKAVPKFKRGQIVECNKCYCRIVKVNNDSTYVITTNPDVYNSGSAYAVANEGELKEVQ